MCVTEQVSQHQFASYWVNDTILSTLAHKRTITYQPVTIDVNKFISALLKFKYHGADCKTIATCITALSLFTACQFYFLGHATCYHKSEFSKWSGSLIHCTLGVCTAEIH